MSIRVIAQVWEHFPHGGSKLLAMLALADWAGDDGGRVYPSVKRLAHKIRMSERQAKRLLESLIDDGFVELLTPENRGGSGKSNRYRIRLETLTKCHSSAEKSRTFSTGNPDKLSENSDIATSDYPLEPLGTVNGSPAARSAPSASQWSDPRESKVEVLQKWIAHLQKLPERMVPPGELERARDELRTLAPETAQEKLL